MKLSSEQQMFFYYLKKELNSFLFDENIIDIFIFDTEKVRKGDDGLDYQIVLRHKASKEVVYSDYLSVDHIALPRARNAAIDYFNKTMFPGLLFKIKLSLVE
jgi:hypothetical protein